MPFPRSAPFLCQTQTTAAPSPPTQPEQRFGGCGPGEGTAGQGQGQPRTPHLSPATCPRRCPFPQRSRPSGRDHQTAGSGLKWLLRVGRAEERFEQAGDGVWHRDREGETALAAAGAEGRLRGFTPEGSAGGAAASPRCANWGSIINYPRAALLRGEPPAPSLSPSHIPPSPA